jgi:DNA-binding MarR family transcriptional regulator
MISADTAARGGGQEGQDTAGGVAGVTSAEQIVALLHRYRSAMRAALEAAGYQPVPPAANWLLLALARRSGSVGDLAGRLRIQKQAASRLADTLVTLGYCERERSEANRRQVLLHITHAGASAAAALLSAIENVDAEILGQLDDTQRQAFRRTLALLTGTG